MSYWILLAICGAAGAVCRMQLDRHFANPDPALLSRGILIANLLGSFILGTASGISDINAYWLLTQGFCGALTTWSTFSLDTAKFLHARRYRLAILNVIFNVGGGWLVAWVGYLLSMIIFS